MSSGSSWFWVPGEVFVKERSYFFPRTNARNHVFMEYSMELQRLVGRCDIQVNVRFFARTFLGVVQRCVLYIDSYCPHCHALGWLGSFLLSVVFVEQLPFPLFSCKLSDTWSSALSSYCAQCSAGYGAPRACIS